MIVTVNAIKAGLVTVVQGSLLGVAPRRQRERERERDRTHKTWENVCGMCPTLSVDDLQPSLTLLLQPFWRIGVR